jgi:hypothetical protein
LKFTIDPTKTFAKIVSEVGNDIKTVSEKCVMALRLYYIKYFDTWRQKCVTDVEETFSSIKSEIVHQIEEQKEYCTKTADLIQNDIYERRAG